MSEANTPQNPHCSENDHFLPDDSLDELIASLDNPPSSEAASNFDEPVFLDEQEEILENPQQGELSNEVLYEQNHQLLYRNAQLQKALESTQAELEQYKFRLRQAEDLNEQQSDELNAAYEQHLSLSQELKTARQKGEYQEEQITHLSQTLQASQQRVAQLERECALIQKQFQDYSYKLSQAEQESQALFLRLQQQRRYTWQFKLALNKCLENNPESDDSFSLTSVSSQPIPAWSELASLPTAGASPKQESTQDEVTPAEEVPDGSDQQDSLVEDILDSYTESMGTFAATATEEETREAELSQPSPILNPKGNRKKRQSYAAVQLPNFIS